MHAAFSRCGIHPATCEGEGDVSRAEPSVSLGEGDGDVSRAEPSEQIPVRYTTPEPQPGLGCPRFDLLTEEQRANWKRQIRVSLEEN